MFGQGFNSGFFGGPKCFTDTTDIFKDNSGVALYTLDYDASAADGGGKFREAAKFNNTNSYIELPSTIDDPMRSGSAFTVSLWYKHATQTNSYGGAIMKLLNDIYNLIDVETNGTIRARVLSSSSVTSEVTSSALTVGDWYHIVWTGNTASGVSLYINNSLVGNTTWDGTFLTYTNSNYKYNRLGYQNQSVASLVGEIDQVRFFNRLITSAEVSTLYNESNETTDTLQILGDSSCYAAYTLNNNVNDLSGNYNATSSNLVYTNINGIPSNVDFGVGGKSLYGARFNGSNSYITVPTLSGFTNYNFTMSFWFNSTSTAAQYFMDFRNPIYMEFGYDVGSGAYNNTYSFIIYTGSQYALHSSANLRDGNWHHIAVTYDGVTLKMYIDNATPITSTPNDNTQFSHSSGNKIGASATGTAVMNGSIDQVRIFNRALNSTEISKLYGNGAGEIACKYTATTTDIAYPIANTAYYKLDNNSKDLSRTSGKFNEGAIFNGSSSAITLPPIAGLPTNSNNTNNFTFSCWVKSTTTRLNNGGGSNPIFQNNVGSYQFIGFGGNDNGNFPTGKLFYYTYGGSGQHNSWIITPNTYDNGQWHHLVVTDKYNSAGNNRTRTLYVDGAQIVQDTVDKNFLNSTETNHTLGDSTGTGNRHADIDLDQVRIFNKAVSPSEVTTLYNETKNTTGTLQILGDTSCIATYQLDGNSTDLSGNYNGTDTDVKYAYDGTESNIEYRFGKYGQAAKFPALASSYIDTGIKSLGSDFSLSFWFNPDYIDGSSGYRNPLGKYWAGSGNAELLLTFNDNGTIATYVYYGSGYSNSVSSTHPNTVSNGNWYHYCITWQNGVQLKTYLNNVSATTTTSASKNSNTVPLYIGAIDNRGAGGGSSWNSYAWSGLIDQVRVYNTALTDNQVTKLYNEKPEVDTSNFKTVLYEGTSAKQYISNVGMDLETSGGLIWLKSRDSADNHNLGDSVRGVQKFLYSNLTSQELTSANYFTSFEKNGFFIGTDNSINKNNDSFVSWVWKGGGTAVSNTDGTITSQVSANTAAGFSIVKWTGTGVDGKTIGHGLTSSSPEIIFTKGLTNATSWVVGIGGISGLGINDYFTLNTSNIKYSSTTFYQAYSTNTFQVGVSSANEMNKSASNDYISYCWHSVAGYSKIGSYTGDGTTSGNIITTGFEPSFLLTKPAGPTGGYWYILDNKRNTSNPINTALFPNDSLAEITSTNYNVDFLSTGFELKNNTIGYNQNNETYLYMAFK